jgi:hypothetical protein
MDRKAAQFVVNGSGEPLAGGFIWIVRRHSLV